MTEFGVGTYIRNVVRTLAQLDRDSEYFLIGSSGKVAECGALLARAGVNPAPDYADEDSRRLVLGFKHGDRTHLARSLDQTGIAAPVTFSTSEVELSVSVNVLPPGTAVPGLMLLISGVAGTTGSILKVAAFWLKPPPGAGFEAVICAIPGAATSEAKTVSAI